MGFPYKMGRKIPVSRRLRESAYQQFFGYMKPNDFFHTPDYLQLFYCYLNSEGHHFVMKASRESISDLATEIEPYVLFATGKEYDFWKYRQREENGLVSTTLDEESGGRDSAVSNAVGQLDGIVLE